MDLELKEVVDRLIKIENLLQEQSLYTKEILCFDEASQFLDLSKSYLYKLTSRGEISFYRPQGKKLYFERKGLLEWIKRNRSSTNHELLLKANQIDNRGQAHDG